MLKVLRAGLVLILGLMAVPARLAHAQPGPAPVAASSAGPAARAQAVQIYRRALELSAKGELPAAIELFEQAFRLGALRNALWNLAQCQRQLGQLMRARRSMEQFRDHPLTPAGDLKLAATELALLEGQLARVEVSTRPAGAAVLVDGQPVGAAPLGVWLDPGAHVLDVSSPGFAPVRQELRLRTGERRPLPVTLTLLPAILRVDSSPAGAEVRVSGRPVGRTPLRTEVPAGTFEVAASLAGRRTERRRVTVNPGEQTALTLPLVEPLATLVIDVQNPGARISLGGVPLGTAPLLPRRVPPGSAPLAVQLPGHDRWQQTVALEDGQTAAVTVRLQRGRLHPAWFAAAAGLGAALLGGGGALLAGAARSAATHRSLTTRLEDGLVPLRQVDQVKARMTELLGQSRSRFDGGAALLAVGGAAVAGALVLTVFTRWRRSDGRVTISGPGRAALEGRF